MNRETKFRGRKNSTKEWIYGSLISDKTKGYAIVQITDNPISNGVVNGWCFGIEKGTECEFIGLKDKNGVEMYEGDIIKFDDGYLSEIIFYQGAFGCEMDANFSTLNDTNLDIAKVIGNIHENPELIK